MASTEDKPANKENTSSWKDSIYNPRTGELLGRTASSWGKSPVIQQSVGRCFDFHCLSTESDALSQSLYNGPFRVESAVRSCAWMDVSGCAIDAG